MIAGITPDAKEGKTEARIRRRLVLFVHGFDPRGAEKPYAILREELPKYGKLNGVAATLSAVETPLPDQPRLKRWRVTLADAGSEVETVFEFLGWQDLIPRYRPFRFIRLTLASIATFYVMLWKGIFHRLPRYGWSHFGFAAVPFLGVSLYIGVIVGAVVLGFAVGASYGTGGAVVGTALGVVVAAGFYTWTVSIDGSVYFWFLMALWTFQRRQGGRGGILALEQRLDQLAEHALRTAADPAFDEVVMVCVSHGGYCGIEIVGRMLGRDPDLASLRGGKGGGLALVTLGSQPSMTAWFGPRPGFRKALRAILASPAVDWFFYTLRGDIMAAGRYDPIADTPLDPSGLDATKPFRHHIHLKRMLGEGSSRALGWRFLPIHLQYLMASATGEEHDFVALTCASRPFRSAAATWRERALESKKREG
jgi:hypothetical protein